MKAHIDAYFDEHVRLLRAVEATARDGAGIPFADAVYEAGRMLADCRSTRRKVIFVGNGGSAAIASHCAVDFWHVGGIRSISFLDGPQLTCMANDYGYEQVYSKPVEAFADAGDVLVAISSSGRSANIIRAVEKAREFGCSVVTLTGFSPDNLLRRAGDLSFYVPTSCYGHVETLHAAVLHGVLDCTRAGGRPERI